MLLPRRTPFVTHWQEYVTKEQAPDAKYPRAASLSAELLLLNVHFANKNTSLTQAIAVLHRKGGKKANLCFPI